MVRYRPGMRSIFAGRAWLWGLALEVLDWHEGAAAGPVPHVTKLVVVVVAIVTSVVEVVAAGLEVEAVSGASWWLALQKRQSPRRSVTGLEGVRSWGVDSSFWSIEGGSPVVGAAGAAAGLMESLSSTSSTSSSSTSSSSQSSHSFSASDVEEETRLSTRVGFQCLRADSSCFFWDDDFTFWGAVVTGALTGSAAASALSLCGWRGTCWCSALRPTGLTETGCCGTLELMLPLNGSGAESEAAGCGADLERRSANRLTASRWRADLRWFSSELFEEKCLLHCLHSIVAATDGCVDEAISLEGLFELAFDRDYMRKMWENSNFVPSVQCC